jgi:hypothetical protein
MFSRLHFLGELIEPVAIRLRLRFAGEHPRNRGERIPVDYNPR